MTLPIDSAARKRIPLFSGCFAYFPDALVGVARVSFDGNEKHNPGEPLHWSRGKSDDHEDCIQRHTFDAFKATSLAEKVEHLRCRAWRALAALQLAEEALEAQTAFDEEEADYEATRARLIEPVSAFDESPANGYPYGARTVEEVEQWQAQAEDSDEFSGLPSFYRIVP